MNGDLSQYEPIGLYKDLKFVLIRLQSVMHNAVWLCQEKGSHFPNADVSSAHPLLSGTLKPHQNPELK